MTTLAARRASLLSIIRRLIMMERIELRKDEVFVTFPHIGGSMMLWTALSRSAYFTFTIAIAVVLLSVPPVLGVLIDWDGNESVDGNFDGAFGIANNWSPNQVPVVGDIAFFKESASYTVQFNANAASDELQVDSGDITFASTGGSHSYALTSGNATAQLNGGQVTILGVDLDIGNALSINNATLLLKDGTIFSGGGSLSMNPGGGTVIVDGAGSTWMNSGFLFLELGAELDVLNGGAVLSNSSQIDGSAKVSVDGVDSAWTNLTSLSVANTDGGTLNILNGGMVSNSFGFIANLVPTSTGTVTVDGVGSHWINSNTLSIGASGDGTLNILNGGRVSSASGELGINSNNASIATVDGAGSKWMNLGNLRVGAFGILSIKNGGTVESNQGEIDGLFGNAVTIDGSATTWTNAGDLFVGGTSSSASSAGRLVVQNDGLLEVVNLLKVWNTGAVTINGGMIALDALDIVPGGAFAFNFGTLNFTSEISVVPNDSLERALGGSHTVYFGQTLQVDGITTLNDLFTIDGGTFSTPDLVNPHLLQFNKGKFAVTGAGGMTIGPAGPFGNSVTVEASQSLSVTNTASVDPGATLEVQTGGTFAAGLLANNGQVGGTGVIQATIANSSTGEIFVGVGEQLRVLGGGHTNAGQFTLGNGTINFDGDVANQATGLILGAGAYRAGGGTINNGAIALSATSLVIGDVINNGIGQITVTGGTTTFLDDVTNDGALHISAGATAVFFGSLAGSQGTTGAGDARLEGDLKPGNSPGAMAFGGDLAFGPAAQIEIELGGLAPGIEFDVVSAANEISLDGTLAVSTIIGFVPSAGDMFQIISAADVQGTFNTVLLPGLSGNLEWLLDYQPTSVSLLVAIPGDFDFDGDVDDFDFLTWQRGQSPNPLSASDLSKWEANFGTTASTLSAGAAVPEPGALLLSMIAGGTAIYVSRRPSQF